MLQPFFSMQVRGLFSPLGFVLVSLAGGVGLEGFGAGILLISLVQGLMDVTDGEADRAVL